VLRRGRHIDQRQAQATEVTLVVARGKERSKPVEIPYTLVITVAAPGTGDLYDQVVRRYRSVLEPLTPLIQIPVRT
jgi:hypothetical protein